MKTTGTSPTMSDLVNLARSGNKEDVNTLMGFLEGDVLLVTCKKIDYAMGLIISEEGRNQIRHYLFNGIQIQRNYAALYFKRLGAAEILKEAVNRGCIDEIMAYSR